MKETRRVLYNDKHGGFSISKEAKEKLLEYGMDEELVRKYDELIFRDHPIALKVFDELGTERFSNKIVCRARVEEVPKTYSFVIDEYDGLEDIILKPRKNHIINLINQDEVEELLDYLEQADCLRE